MMHDAESKIVKPLPVGQGMQQVRNLQCIP